jgi:hypothetical protein
VSIDIGVYKRAVVASCTSRRDVILVIFYASCCLVVVAVGVDAAVVIARFGYSVTEDCAANPVLMA